MFHSDTNTQFILNLSSLMTTAVNIGDVWSQSLTSDLHSAVFSLEINLGQFFVRPGSTSVFPFETPFFGWMGSILSF